MYWRDEIDLLLVTSTGDPEGTAAAIRAARPAMNAMTNDEVVGRLQQAGFSYFRQISSVLTAVTVSFAVLLITVLLTVSVNQRLGEIAALRALGFSRSRVVKDVLSESALIVGTGGLLSLPLGFLLATGLDHILRGMPGIPSQLHFFVFERDALTTHIGLLVATALIAALYPMRLVSKLPIAATLRDEVIG
jgi:putative ABC transport system permease protein